MNFRKHYAQEGRHAFLSASKWHWINYDDEKIAESYLKFNAKRRGTILHELAAVLISLNIKLPKSRKTLNMYVNDCIKQRMKPEQMLYYSINCFGTADAISFRGNKLCIFDLKTGLTPAHMEQLMVYAALFCLEYGVKPGDITYELRIYQNNEVIIFEPTVEDIAPIMDRIVSADKVLQRMQQEEEEELDSVEKLVSRLYRSTKGGMS